MRQYNQIFKSFLVVIFDLQAFAWNGEHQGWSTSNYLACFKPQDCVLEFKSKNVLTMWSQVTSVQHTTDKKKWLSYRSYKLCCYKQQSCLGYLISFEDKCSRPQPVNESVVCQVKPRLYFSQSQDTFGDSWDLSLSKFSPNHLCIDIWNIM